MVSANPSPIFDVDFDDAQKKVLELLSRPQYRDVWNKSPRTVGDSVEEIVRENIAAIVADIKNYQERFARRAMADVAFEDAKGKYYFVDVKTHNLNTTFNMPNLTSVKRIAQFYEDDNNCFCLLKIDYDPISQAVKKVHFLPIEYLKWSCLTIGALGWGQIQIANANVIDLDPKQTRQTWMLELCKTLEVFYPQEVEKINERIAFFKTIKARWECTP